MTPHNVMPDQCQLPGFEIPLTLPTFPAERSVTGKVLAELVRASPLMVHKFSCEERAGTAQSDFRKRVSELEKDYEWPVLREWTTVEDHAHVLRTCMQYSVSGATIRNLCQQCPEFAERIAAIKGGDV